MNTAYTDFRTRHTPIPTPAVVRLIGSVLVGLSLAVITATGTVSLPIALLVAVSAAAGAVGLTLTHPYRRRLRDYATQKNVTMLPSIAQLIPLILWWMLGMTLVIFPLPLWGTALIWLAGVAVAFLLYPHVDGTRKLAYA